MSRASIWKSVVPAAVLTAVFAVAFFLGRNTVPYEISISAEHPVFEEPSAQTPQESVTRVLPEAIPDNDEFPDNADRTDKVDLNCASKEELMTLPGIGEKLAERILEYRENAGRFSAPEQIMDVEGIGEGVFEKIRESITVGDLQ